MKALTGLPVDSFLEVSEEVGIPLKSLLGVVEQVEKGVSAAFLARYRVDLCAGMDEDRIHGVLDRLRDHRDVRDRRLAMLTTLSQRGTLTPEIKAQLEGAATRRELRDIYAPFRQGGRGDSDPAEKALGQGLDPLARALWFQDDGVDIEAEAGTFADPAQGVEDTDQALAGAYAIAARWLSEKPEILLQLRNLFLRECELSVKAKPRGRKDPRWQALDGYKAKAKDIPWRKHLAIRRGVRQGMLKTRVEGPVAAAGRYLESCLIKNPDSKYAPHLQKVVAVAIKNGVSERVRRDVLQQIDEKTDRDAIASFRKTVRSALLGPTAHGRRIVGIETGRPGGWRAALIDGDGALVDSTVVRGTQKGKRAGRAKAQASPSSAPTAAPGSSKAGEPTADTPADPAGDAGPEASRKVKGAEKPDGTELCEFLRDQDVDLIIYGTGPKPHETESFVRSQIRRSGNCSIAWRAVRDGRAWIYGRSRAARKEFPDLEPAVRSAISHARRVQDPLAELAKSDPRTLGLGAGYYDVSAERLRRLLRRTVEGTVHDVGVDLNRAPPHLLAMVPGFNDRLARRVADYRQRNGPFPCRDDVRKVDGLSDKIFHQAVGFLRVHGSEPLDATGAHPAFRKVFDEIAAAAGCDLATLVSEPRRLDEIDPESIASQEHPLGLVKSAIAELRPERSRLRGIYSLPAPAVPLRPEEQLLPGSKVTSVVSSISDYGAWVDIGGDRDALLHVSQIHREHIEDSRPSFRPGDELEVYIRPPSGKNGRVSLTMWAPRSRPRPGRTAGRYPGKPQWTDRNRSNRRGFGGRDRKRKPVRSFGPKSGRRPRRRLSMAEKLDMLQDKYRTKV